MRVRLTRKLAKEIDGVDLAENQVGDLIELSDRKGRMLIAEGWAIPERRSVLSFRRQRKHPLRRAGDDISQAS